MSEKNEFSRNSALRRTFSKVTGGIAEWIHDNTDLTPNNVTAIGTGLVAVGAVMAYVGNRPEEKHANRWRTASSVVTAVGEGLDAIDGALFRHKKQKQQEGDKSVNVVESPNSDAKADRIGEGVKGLARQFTAIQRGDEIGAILASAATIMQPVPSVLRAAAEARGRVLPENGEVPVLDIWGTRAGRSVANVVAMEFPGWPQKVADGLVVASTARTIYQRSKALLKKDPEGKLDILSEQEKEKAKSRLKHMAGMAGIVIGAAVAANMAARKRR